MKRSTSNAACLPQATVLRTAPLVPERPLALAASLSVRFRVPHPAYRRGRFGSSAAIAYLRPRSTVACAALWRRYWQTQDQAARSPGGKLPRVRLIGGPLSGGRELAIADRPVSRGAEIPARTSPHRLDGFHCP